MRYLLLCCLLLVTALAGAFPRLGHVNDYAGLLSYDQKQNLSKYLQDLEANRQVDGVICIIESLKGHTAQKAATAFGNMWKVGGEESTGFVLLIAQAERTAFLATGEGIQKQLPDQAVQEIIDEALLPLLTEDLYYEGIMATLAEVEKRVHPQQGMTAKKWIALSLLLLITVGLLLFIIRYKRGAKNTRRGNEVASGVNYGLWYGGGGSGSSGIGSTGGGFDGSGGGGDY